MDQLLGLGRVIHIDRALDAECRIWRETGAGGVLNVGRSPRSFGVVIGCSLRFRSVLVASRV